MYLKDIIDKKIAINCRTEEEARKLYDNAINGFEILDDSLFIHWWEAYKENTCYRFNSKNDNNKIVWGYCKKSYYEEKDYKIITLDDLEDFKEEEFIIKIAKIIDETLTIEFAFNKTKKKLYLNYLGKEIRVKCDKNDKFEWKIGLGLALYRVYQKNNDVKYMKKNYNYKKLAEYCLYKLYNFDENKIKDLEDRVNNSKENTLIRL